MNLNRISVAMNTPLRRLSRWKLIGFSAGLVAICACSHKKAEPVNAKQTSHPTPSAEATPTPLTVQPVQPPTPQKVQLGDAPRVYHQ